MVAYKLVPGFTGYRVGDDGSVWSSYDYKTRKFDGEWWPMKAPPNGKGYRHLNLRQNSKYHRRFVCWLVLETFVGPRPPGHEACHKNGNQGDDRLTNLRWGTKLSNEHDKREHGTDNKGERNGMSTLDAKRVRKIRRLYATGNYTQTYLAGMFHISQSAVCNIVRRKQWAHI